MPKFKWDPNPLPDDGTKRQKRNPYELDNGIVYHGEWNNDGLRDGKGTQYWPDGSIYVGYWLKDCAHGRGRLIHADLDYYEGDWLKDKAHGYGYYFHKAGQSYEGEWENDRQSGYGIE